MRHRAPGALSSPGCVWRYASTGVSTALPRVTPMLRQYFEMKSRVPDAILFYRMGDFYEMFFDDAKDAAPLLGIALTKRHRDSDIEAPMCGVPHQAVDHHVAKLVAAGRKVAICDQVEDPRAAPRAGPPGHHARRDPGHGPRPRVARSRAPRRTWRRSSRARGVGRRVPRSFDGALPSRSRAGAARRGRPGALPAPRNPPPGGGPVPAFPAALSRRGAARGGRPREGGPAAAAWSPPRPPGHMHPRCVPEGSPTSRSRTPLSFDRRMGLDASAVATLELFESSDGSAVPQPVRHSRPHAHAPGSAGAAGGSGPSVPRSGRHRVALGRRGRARSPSGDRRGAAGGRSRASATSNGDSRGSPSGRPVRGRSAALGAGLRAAPAVAEAAGPLLAGRFRSLLETIPDTSDCVAAIESTLAPSLPCSLPRAERSATAPTPSSTSCAPCGATRRAPSSRSRPKSARRSGISSVKVRFNRVFGYSLEVSQRAPRQGSGRLGPQAIAGQRREVLHDGAEGARGEDPGRRRPHCRDRSPSLRERCSPSSRGPATASGRTARVMGELDLFASLAETARSGRWVRPRLSERPRLTIVEGRHPVVERAAARGALRPERHRPRRSSTGSRSSPGPTWPASRRTCARSRRSSSSPRPAASSRPSSAELSVVRPDLHARGRRRSPLARRVDVHGRDARVGRDPPRTPRPAASSSSTRSAAAPRTFDGLSIAWALLEYLHDAPGEAASPSSPRTTTS